MKTYVILTFFVLFQAAANFILKYSGQQAKSFWGQYINPYVVVALACYGLSFLLWVHALAISKLSLAISFSVLNYVIIITGSYFFFHEEINAYNGTGMFLITIGLIFVVKGL